MKTDTRSSTSPDRVPVELHVPFPTIVKVLFTALLVWVALKLTLAFLFFVLAVVFAIALSSPMLWLERRGLSHGIAVTLIALAIVGVIAASVAFVVPPLFDQMLKLWDNFGAYGHQVETNISPEHPVLRSLVLQILALPKSPEVAASLKKPLAWGKVAVSGGLVAFLIVVLTIYLLLDGKRLYAWLLAYMPRRHRRKMAEALPEVFDVVIAYVQGQAFTSLLYGLFALAVLTVFKVPAAIPLAFLAAICDVLPVLGVILSTVPAVLLALTMSPLAAGAVLALYALYHTLENYVIVPRVYGRRLQLSGLAVLIALVIGGTLMGILGALLILPLVAAYPIIERIWLHEYLSSEVVGAHSALEKAAAEGSDEAVDRVLEGVERHDAAAPSGLGSVLKS